MAIFQDQRELERQKQPLKFKKQTGWKKTAMAALGYKDDGTKNTFGKYFGHGNVALDYYAPKALAKGSDSEKVIESSKSEQWERQFSTAKFASNFVGGGMGGGSGSGAGGGMMSKAGGMFGKGGGGAAGKGTKMGNSMASIMGGSGGGGDKLFSGNANVDAMNKSAAMDSANEGLNNDITNSNILEKTNDVNDIDNYQTEEDFLSATGDSPDDYRKSEKSLKSVKGMPIVGDLSSAVTSRFKVSDKLEKTRKAMMLRRESDKNNAYDLY